MRPAADADQNGMVEPGHLQGCRIKHGKNETDDDLPAHEASDRIVDFAPKRPNIVAVRRGKPAIDRRNHSLPVNCEIDGDDRRDDEQRKKGNQGQSARPQRAKEVIEPVAAHRLRDIGGGLLDMKLVAHDTVQPRAACIGHERLESCDVAGKLLNKKSELANDGREHHQEKGDKARDQRQEDGQSCEGTINPEPLQPVDHRNEQIGEQRTDDERQQDLAQQHQRNQGDRRDRNPERGWLRNSHRRSPHMRFRAQLPASLPTDPSADPRTSESGDRTDPCSIFYQAGEGDLAIGNVVVDLSGLQT